MTTECVLCDRHFHQTTKNPGCICPECLLEQEEEGTREA